ncbi:MAG: zinc ABC transporter substrate-binding protein [Gammaproteobacteria bacterium PRO9]|nr:zinc ABC transporter substrate-binding protein [Gammaproteobacteria bacterium PRO9]
MFIRTCLLLLLALPMAARADVNVFACEPEWGALTKAIAGDHADITIATTALQDAHKVQARPSLISAIHRARLLVCTGAELEVGWLPLLLRRAGNPEIQPGQPGNLMAASLVHKLEVPKLLDRAEGDIHAEGNPHVITDPRNLEPIARELTNRLKEIDPANAAGYEAAFNAFNKELATRVAGWEKQAARLRGAPIVIQHDVWAYMDAWLGLKPVVSLEPKPGVPPTSAHLVDVLATLRATPAKAIVVAAYENPQASQWLAGKTGLPVLTLPLTVGGNAKATDLFSLYDTTIAQLLAGIK